MVLKVISHFLVAEECLIDFAADKKSKYKHFQSMAHREAEPSGSVTLVTLGGRRAL